MSPGLVARPLGMFSQAGMTPTTFSGRLHARRPRGTCRARCRRRTCRTSSRPCSAAGLIEMPPVSKVMPLPTSDDRRLRLSPRRVAQHDEACGGSSRALATARKAPMPSFSSSLRSSTSTFELELLARASSPAGQIGRRADVGRQVAELARERRRRRRSPGLASACSSCAWRRERQRDLRERRRGRLFCACVVGSGRAPRAARAPRGAGSTAAARAARPWSRPGRPPRPCAEAFSALRRRARRRDMLSRRTRCARPCRRAAPRSAATPGRPRSYSVEPALPAGRRARLQRAARGLIEGFAAGGSFLFAMHARARRSRVFRRGSRE